jgi:multidrug efflux pump subunit AcrA (membrane-fusion protein)
VIEMNEKPGVGLGWREAEDALAARVVLLRRAVVCHGGIMPTIATPPGRRKAQAPIVSVIIPGQRMWRAINATGLLAAKHDMPIASVGEGGQVAQVLVNAGDWVKQGQLLAVIDRSVQVEQDANQQAQVRVSQADARWLRPIWTAR